MKSYDGVNILRLLDCKCDRGSALLLVVMSSVFLLLLVCVSQESSLRLVL